MSRADDQKPKVDNRSIIIKGLIKPKTFDLHNFKTQPTFKPGPRFQSINRGRR